MTEIVYRVQNKNGEGYLKCKEKWRCSKDYTLKDETDRFINPFTDKDLKYYVCDYPEKVNPFIYGFKNKKDLYIWFRMNELLTLNFYGFDIYEIKVKIKNNHNNNNIIYGNRQLIFNKNFIVEEKLGNINLHYKEFNEIYKNYIEKLYNKEFNFCLCSDCIKPTIKLDINEKNDNNNNNNENINDDDDNNDDDDDSSSDYDSDD